MILAMSKSSHPPSIGSRRKVPAAWSEFAGDRHFATTLARGLELLRCFTPAEPLLGVTELARRLSLPVSTVSRLAYTLVQMGYLTQAQGWGKYRLGVAMLSLGYPLLDQFPFRQRVRPLLMAFAQEVDGNVSIGIRDRLNIVYIESIRARERGAYALDVGVTQSLAGTAVGRAYLMSCSTEERMTLINEIKVKAPLEWERHAQRVMDNVAQYPQRGCCISMGEVYPEVQAVAVPLGRIDGGMPAAINCSFFGREMNERWLLEDVGPRLIRLARQLA